MVPGRGGPAFTSPHHLSRRTWRPSKARSIPRYGHTGRRVEFDTSERYRPCRPVGPTPPRPHLASCRRIPGTVVHQATWFARRVLGASRPAKDGGISSQHSIHAAVLTDSPTRPSPSDSAVRRACSSYRTHCAVATASRTRIRLGHEEACWHCRWHGRSPSYTGRSRGAVAKGERVPPSDLSRCSKVRVRTGVFLRLDKCES